MFIQNHCMPKGPAKICLLTSVFTFSFSFAWYFNPVPRDETEGKYRVKKKVSHRKVALLGMLRSSKTVTVFIVSLHVTLIFRENHV